MIYEKIRSKNQSSTKNLPSCQISLQADLRIRNREGRCGEERRGGVFIAREEEGRGLTGSGIAHWSEDSHSDGPSFLHKHILAPSWEFGVCENHLPPLLAFWAFKKMPARIFTGYKSKFFMFMC